jgi:allantoate deiminase
VSSGASPRSEPIAADGALEPSAVTEGLDGVEVDARRLSTLVDDLAQISAEGRGVTRPGYSLLERRAHQLVAERMSDLGLRVWVDAAGNTIGELAGAASGLPAIATGSHLDSVPHGGRFDGVAGVVASVECVALLVENGISLHHPLRVVCFASEEGARFGQACLGSQAIAGGWAERDPSAYVDEDGVRLADAMRTIGIDPSRIAEAMWTRQQCAAFLELHIEQGRVLEDLKAQIGIVDLVSGSTRLALQVRGQASHTGSTPMAQRADALVAAAEIVLTVERIALDPEHRGTRATVGRLIVEPGNITTIPGVVDLSIDVRDVDSNRQRQTAWEIVRRADEICVVRGVTLSARIVADSSPVVLPIWIRSIVSRTCRDLRVPYRVVTSGASHDAQLMNPVAPSGIIFVPSRAGLSHVPDEWTSISDLAVGTRVLLRSLLALDADLIELDRAGAEMRSAS